MDVLPSGNIFNELERICTTGYFSSQPSIEDQWQQTCYELERYLRDEPKLQSYKTMHTALDTAWDIFSTPARLLEELKIKESLDSISTTSSVSSNCSGISWNSNGSQTLSCAVLVKQERIDDEDDIAQDSTCDDKLGMLFSTLSSIQSPSLSISRTGNMAPTSNSNCISNGSKSSVSNSSCNNLGFSSICRNTPAIKVRMVHGQRNVLPPLTPPSSPESSLRGFNYVQQQHATQDIDALKKQQFHQQRQRQQVTLAEGNSTSAFGILTSNSQTPFVVKTSSLTQTKTIEVQHQQQKFAVQHLSISPQTFYKPTSNNNISSLSSSSSISVGQSSSNHSNNITRSTFVRLATANGTPGAAGISLARVLQMQNNGDSNVAALLSVAATNNNSSKNASSMELQEQKTSQIVPVVTSQLVKPTTAFKKNHRPYQHHSDHSPESKRRIHKCQFLGCKKVYTKSSHLKAHQRTHTVDMRPRGLTEAEINKIINFAWNNSKDEDEEAEGEENLEKMIEETIDEVRKREENVEMKLITEIMEGGGNADEAEIEVHTEKMSVKHLRK